MFEIDEMSKIDPQINPPWCITSDLASVDIFGRTRSTPVRRLTELWGDDGHFGTPEGTCQWCIMGGMKQEDAEIVSLACKWVDYHKDTNPLNINNPEAQKWHFNTLSNQGIVGGSSRDARIVVAIESLKTAVNLNGKDLNGSLEILGKGLHPLQDTFAHADQFVTPYKYKGKVCVCKMRFWDDALLWEGQYFWGHANKRGWHADNLFNNEEDDKVLGRSLWSCDSLKNFNQRFAITRLATWIYLLIYWANVRGEQSQIVVNRVNKLLGMENFSIVRNTFGPLMGFVEAVNKSTLHLPDFLKRYTDGVTFKRIGELCPVQEVGFWDMKNRVLSEAKEYEEHHKFNPHPIPLDGWLSEVKKFRLKVVGPNGGYVHTNTDGWLTFNKEATSAEFGSVFSLNATRPEIFTIEGKYRTTDSAVKTGGLDCSGIHGYVGIYQGYQSEWRFEVPRVNIKPVYVRLGMVQWLNKHSWMRAGSTDNWLYIKKTGGAANNDFELFPAKDDVDDVPEKRSTHVTHWGEGGIAMFARKRSESAFSGQSSQTMVTLR